MNSPKLLFLSWTNHSLVSTNHSWPNTLHLLFGNVTVFTRPVLASLELGQFLPHKPKETKALNLKNGSNREEKSEAFLNEKKCEVVHIS